MIPRSGRLALWCLALLFAVSLYMKGRVPAEKGEGAALSREAKGHVTVRLGPGFAKPGIYRFPDGTSLETAIKMTVDAEELGARVEGVAGRPLKAGEVVAIMDGPHGSRQISVEKMAVKERMLLGIALDADQLQAEEWELLPGIGPALSQRIVADRHKNGAFGSLEGVARVPGIGPKKLAAISRYF